MPNVAPASRGEPCAGPCGGLLHEDEDQGGHHKDVDAGEIPDDFEVGVVAREMFLHHHVAQPRGEVSGEEGRDADAHVLRQFHAGGNFTR